MNKAVNMVYIKGFKMSESGVDSGEGYWGLTIFFSKPYSYIAIIYDQIW